MTNAAMNKDADETPALPGGRRMRARRPRPQERPYHFGGHPWGEISWIYASDTPITPITP